MPGPCPERKLRFHHGPGRPWQCLTRRQRARQTLSPPAAQRSVPLPTVSAPSMGLCVRRRPFRSTLAVLTDRRPTGGQGSTHTPPRGRGCRRRRHTHSSIPSTNTATRLRKSCTPCLHRRRRSRSAGRPRAPQRSRGRLHRRDLARRPCLHRRTSITSLPRANLSNCSNNNLLQATAALEAGVPPSGSHGPTVPGSP